MGNKLPWILGAGAVAGGLTAGYLVGKKSAGAKKPQGKALTLQRTSWKRRVSTTSFTRQATA